MSIWEKKQVLVTGGAGFIGSNLVVRLVEAGAEVRVIDSLEPSLGGNPHNLATVKDRIRFEHADLRDAGTLDRSVAEAEFIFHLAGNVSHLDSMKDPLFDLGSNVEATIRLLEACRKSNPKAVIAFASTRQLYGTPHYLPVDEKHPIAPVDVNGINKLAAERYHALYARVYGLKTVSLRLTNTYGPRQLLRHSRQGFVGWFVNRALTNQRVQLYGGGAQVRDFTYVEDVVDAFLLAAGTERCHGDVFNLDGERLSLESFARLLLEIHPGGSLEIVDFPPEKKKIDIGDYYGTAAKFREATGWTPKIGVKEGLARMLTFYQDCRDQYLDPQ